MNALEVAKALAAKLNAAGEDYEASALPDGGLAQARLASKADKAKTVDLLVRAVPADAASGAFQDAFAAKLGAPGKKTGALTALAASEPKTADAAKLATAVTGLVASFAKAKADATGVKSMKGLPDESGLKVASWADEAGAMTVNLLHRVATPTPKTAGSPAAVQWLVVVQPDDARPTVRVVPVPLPEGDVIRARWWASPKGPGWAFRPF